MGCGPSNQPVGAAKGEPLNAADQLLIEAQEAEKYNFKILLLGAGESGKSTVVKQIKIIWNVQDSDYEKVKYILALRRNILEAIQCLLQASLTLNVPLGDEALKPIADEVIEMDETVKFTPEVAKKIDDLWRDSGIQTVFGRRNEFWNMDATPYYLNEVYRIADKDFEPTEEDMIMTRVRTTGIVVSEVLEKPYSYQIVDVGGQRSERRKWIHCFDDVKAIIYLASLSGYNQVLFEDCAQNIMHESITLFEDVVKNPIFKDTPMFLFLNKKDLFEVAIKKHPLTMCFPDYTGEDGEMAPALDFIKKKFEETLHKHTPLKTLHTHVIAARVRLDMKLAFGEVKDTLKKLNAQNPRKSTGLSPATRTTSRKEEKDGRSVRQRG